MIDAAELARLRERTEAGPVHFAAGAVLPLIDAVEKAQIDLDAMSQRAGNASRMIEALESERDSARVMAADNAKNASLRSARADQHVEERDSARSMLREASDRLMATSDMRRDKLLRSRIAKELGQ